MSARLAPPSHLFGDRHNSRGFDFGDAAAIARLRSQLESLESEVFTGGPLVDGVPARRAQSAVHSPANVLDRVGTTGEATTEEIRFAFDRARDAFDSWSHLAASRRAAALERAADRLESYPVRFLSLLVREAGKTIPDAIAEIRETVDFCRYYAARGREQFGAPLRLPGSTGEINRLSLHGRGVFACISPWNFPLAIFAGQVVAALMAGNTVVAKPAPATTLIAYEFSALLHECGVPAGALHLTPCEGPAFAASAFGHPALAGVAFTGSTQTALTINRALAAREGAIVPMIAETGGLNAMVVDSTALPEQVADDVITSAFTSAGQRCSALRVLYLQQEIADVVIGLLIGAMDALVLGNPSDIATDVGPVISRVALQRLQRHVEVMTREARLLHSCRLQVAPSMGFYIAPHLFELQQADRLREEVFGPILHVYRFRSWEKAHVLHAIRSTGFGLTLGIHSRLKSFAEEVMRHTAVGNTYVNRNMIGAVVGVQPFGGGGRSGTGPKAGGPHYLARFAIERTVTVNTTAIGGNPDLLGT